MSTLGRPDNNAGDARQLLIDAARAKFIHKAYDKVSIRELAQHAGVNSAMIKYYFVNKEGLYKAMIMEVTGQIVEKINQHLSDTDLDNLEDFFKSFFDVIKESPDFPLLMLREVMLNQGVCRDYFLEHLGNRHIKAFDGVYKRFNDAGKLRPGIDPKLFRLSLMSLTLYPWYIREVAFIIDGIEYDEAFLQRLIDHNCLLLQNGFFVTETPPQDPI